MSIDDSKFRILEPRAAPRSSAPRVRILALIDVDRLDDVRVVADEIFPSNDVFHVSEPDRLLRTAIELTPEIILIGGADLEVVVDFLDLIRGTGLECEIIPILATDDRGETARCVRAGACAIVTPGDAFVRSLASALDLARERRALRDTSSAAELAILDTLRLDLEEPVTALLALAESLTEDRAELAPELVETVDRIGRAADRVRAVLDDCDSLTDTYRWQASLDERIAVGPLLERVVSRLKSARPGDAVEVEVEGELEVTGGPAELERAIYRAALSLAERGTARGPLRIRADSPASGEVVIEIRLADPSGRAPLSQRRSVVSSLALDACRNVVQRCGGSLEQTSEDDLGRLLRLSLPAKSAATARMV